MAGLLPGGAAIVQAARRDADPNAPVNYTGIIVPTVLQMAEDALSYWTSMTCLYDRYWVADPDVVTLPICMFHVKKITPAFSNEISKKRVILYEPQEENSMSAAAMSDGMRQGVMQTIVDNIVKNPKTYTVEAIVPFQPIGRYVSEGIKTIPDMVTAMSDLLGGDTPGGFTDIWEGVFSSVFAFMKTAGQAAELAGKLPGMDGVSYINMNSLEAMADSCRTLCMKMWTGYDYKYVAISNLTYDKDPKEDDVFRATFTAQEMPVLNVTKPSPLKVNKINRNWAATAITAVQGALVSPLIALTGVKKESESDSGWTDMIKGALGK